MQFHEHRGARSARSTAVNHPVKHAVKHTDTRARDPPSPLMPSSCANPATLRPYIWSAISLAASTSNAKLIGERFRIHLSHPGMDMGLTR
jgi:hypothetical protein